MKDIFRIIAIILFILWLIVLWKGPSFFTSEDFTVPAGQEDDMMKPGEETKGQSLTEYASLIDKMNSPFAVERYQPLLAGNIFVKPEPPPLVFTPDKLKIVSITPVILPFTYNGFIQRADGSIIGQINWAGKTYFVKKGEKFKDYKVLEISSRLIKAETKEGQFILEYKKPVKGKELIAKLYSMMDEKTFEVKKNDEVNGYKVLDITANSVVLYGQNKEWVVKKGR